MDYMSDVRYMTERFLIKRGIGVRYFSQEQLESLLFKAYKNYYGYDMDEEYAVSDAVHEIVNEYNLTMPRQHE